MAEMETQAKNTTMKRALLVLNVVLLSIGICAGLLIMRLYFLHGGKRVSFSSWLQTGGWPIILVPITISYLHHRPLSSDSATPTKFFFMKSLVFFAAAVIGFLTGFDDYLNAYGTARLPVSTSSWIIASQLAFTAAFADFLVKQKFTSYSINAIFFMTIGAAVVSFHTNNDLADGESKNEYILGFLISVGAAALYGLIMPLVELTYKKARQEISYALVLEFQTVMCFFATVFCIVGMVVNNDFQAIRREAKLFDLGYAKYYVVVVVSGWIWQCACLGTIGVVFSGLSLLSTIITTVLLPVTQILAVIFYKEKFQAEKCESLALSLWGFALYLYGEIKHSKKKKKQIQETEMTQQIPNP